MSRLLKLAQNFNCFYLEGLCSKECRPFFVEGYQIGLIRPSVIKMLLRYPEVFSISSGGVELNPAFRDYEERSVKIDEILRDLRKQNVLIALKGWRDEVTIARATRACYTLVLQCYEVSVGSKSFFKMERSATCLFGIRKYGIYINGYVRHPTLGLCIWLQQRSPTKQTWPNKWDTMVGGGISVGYGMLETAYKEGMEEASIPEDLLKNMTNVGSVSFYFESERGLFPNTEFTYDLELPLEFTPTNNDGEVQKFELLTAKDCYDKMFSTDFKTTSVPIMLDFLIRHGYVSPETEPNYLEIIELLHVPLQTIYNQRLNKENGQHNE